MKIAFVITRFDQTGGAQVHVHDLATALADRGDEVTIVAGSHGALSRRLEDSGIEVTIVPELVRALRPRTDVQAISAVTDLLRAARPDIVSCHSSKAGAIGRIAARRAGVPCIFTAHGWAFTQGVPLRARVLYGVVEGLLAVVTSAIITVSNNDLRLGRRWLPHVRGRMRTVHNAVHDIEDRFRSDPSATPAVGTFVGRFDHQKDHELALRAMTSVPEARLKFVGDGPGRDRLERLRMQLGLSDRVCFVGETSEVAQTLAQSQYFVLLSRWEGLPRSIIEAMRAGLPVLASSVGGTSELVDDGRTGLLVPSGDLGGATNALRRLATSADLRTDLGAAGRSRFEHSFTFDRMLSETLEVYRAVLADSC